MTIRKWEEADRRVVYDNSLRKLEQVDLRMPDGIVHSFVIDIRENAASIVGFTPDNHVVLVKQYRVGPNEVLRELPGGFVDPGENPQEAARRAFIEETGYDGEFQFVGTCIDDAYSTMTRYCFIAKNCKKVGEPQNTSTEQTEVVLLPLKDFRKHLRTGRLTDVEMGYLGLDYLNLL
jgi:ADP-ribose pyrophosphatase